MNRVAGSSAPSTTANGTTRKAINPAQRPKMYASEICSMTGRSCAPRALETTMKRSVGSGALELPSGKVVLLTRLLVGQRATVLQLPVAEREAERHLPAMAQPKIP